MASKTPFLDTAREVILTEADALRTLADALDSRFREAVDLLLAANGRVIVTGIGKSGHIAHKIAATLASTGTPAQFVHPAEASHGDLGMVTRNDVVLAISNSGEAPELANMIAFAKRFEIPLIGLTSKPDSSLGQHSDVVLEVPNLAEACGTGVVPSSSTTMALALGDALAIALMKHRDFTAKDFREFHPGGKLGSKLAKVSDLMHRGDELPLISVNTPMSEALIAISQKGFGVVGILDGKNLAGIITDGDLRRHMDGLLEKMAKDVMTPAPSLVAADDLAESALAVMNAKKITCLFVTETRDASEPVGILHIHDCLRAGLS